MKYNKNILGKAVAAALFIFSCAQAQGQVTVGGNVYGGGNLASVGGNTTVTIDQATGDGATIGGSVFGGGRGLNSDYLKALVSGSATVNFSKGRVMGNVYGGGELGTVGVFTYPAATAEGPTALDGAAPAGSGNTTVTVNGTAVVGPDRLEMPDISGGMVFGAGKGITGDTTRATGNANIPRLAYSANSNVTIGGTAFVKGSVYGGSQNGHVLGNTHVIIQENCQIGAGYNYSSSQNVDMYNWATALAWDGTNATAPAGFYECHHWPYDDDHRGESYDPYADPKGCVAEGIHYDDPYYIKVTEEGVGKFKKLNGYSGATPNYVDAGFTSIPVAPAQADVDAERMTAGGYPYFYEDRTTPTDVKYYYYIDGYRNAGDPDNYYDSHGGSKKAADGRTFYGNVFGGGSGYMPYAAGKWLASAGVVRGNSQVDITGGHILTSVYGGNEMTDVKGTATVNMVAGTVGVPRTDADAVAHPVTCYVFGAGKGDPRTFFNTMTDVQHAYVNISGTARIFGSTFGGGEDGHVDGNAVTNIGGTVNIGGTYVPSSNSYTGGTNYTHSNVIIGSTGTSGVDGNVFGGGRGYSALALTIGLVKGNVETNISAGKIYGSVYGGGRTASTGTYQVMADDVNYGKMLACTPGTDSDDPHTTSINEAEHNHGHVFVNISGTAEIGRIDATIANERGVADSMLAVSPVLGANTPSIGDVFGGGKGLALHDNPELSKKYGWVKNSTVKVYGNAKVNGSVYGGGEISCVGDPDEATPASGQNWKTGFSTVSIYGNATIGTYTNSFGDHGKGYVYGSGKGKAGSHYSEEAFVKNTVVTIGAEAYDEDVDGDAPRIWGSVFGGGEDGHVRKDSKVYIKAGTIGSAMVGFNPIDPDEDKRTTDYDEWYFDPEDGASNVIVYRGNVYAGGRGIDQDEDPDDGSVTFSTTAGAVYGNASVEMTGGHVFHNIYGSGAMASVGTVSNNAVTGKPDYANGTWTATTGNVTVSVTGGTVGDNTTHKIRNYNNTKDSIIYHAGRNNGRVFGAGRGLAGNIEGEAAQMEYVYSTNVTIGGTAQVLGAVYGGGENGHVKTDAIVNIGGNCVIGAPLLQEECLVTEAGAKGNAFRGNVFGGGRGVDATGTNSSHRSFTAGRVYGNTTVNVTGGLIYRAVYGGGMLASVGNPTPSDERVTPTGGSDADRYFTIADWPFDEETNRNGIATVNITGGYIGNVSASDRPIDAIAATAETTATTYGEPGRNNGAVFGSGAGFMATDGSSAQYSQLAYVYRSYVNISDAGGSYPTHIRAAVFGGGENGHVWENATVNVSGGTIGNAPDGSNGGDFAFAGNVFGSGRGMNVTIEGDEDIVSTTAGWVKGNTTVNIWAADVDNPPVICRDVYGGGNLGSVGDPNEVKGTPGNGGRDKFGFKTGLATVNILGGNIYGNVYGSSRGGASILHEYQDMSYVKNTIVNITGTGTIVADVHTDGDNGGFVYGGGNAGHVRRNTEVNVGGAKTLRVCTGLDASGDSVYTTVNASAGGTVGETLYGAGRGSELSGTSGQVNHSVEVNIESGATITRDLYGGGAIANSNVHDERNSASSSLSCKQICTTTVNILGGSIGGDVYGGGRGMLYDANNTAYSGYSDDQKDEIEANCAAIVHGNVQVNIGSADQTTYIAANKGYNDVEIGGIVFGANNINGTPKGSIGVDVYHTKHTDANLFPDTVTTTGGLLSLGHASTRFALQGVYGGGNEASYIPAVADSATRVHIHNCDNTVKMLYGGGRAADVGTTGTGAISANAFVTVDGGCIDTLFAGGDGHTLTDPNQPWNATTNPYRAANIYGDALSTVNSGLYTAVFSGSNTSGTITGTAGVTLSHTGACAELEQKEIIPYFFGGGNVADLGEPGRPVTIDNTIECSDVKFIEVYGGANKANIYGDVTLTIKGGTIGELYGGSKGVADDPATGGVNEAIAANISGNVVLNIQGGTIGKAFGGSNINGNIGGTITVNVNDLGVEGCELEIDSVFGAGNLTAYNPITPGSYPAVNIINGTVNDVVFGGGKQAAVTSSPVVTIGDGIVGHNAAVTGNVYGGGDEAGITGSTHVILNSGTVGNGIYGGCNTSGTVTVNSVVDLLGGQVGALGDTATICGGGYGQLTKVDGDVHVTFGNAAGTATPMAYARMYGGSALGSVNTSPSNVGTTGYLNQVNNVNTTTIDILSGTFNGDIFGGGLGQKNGINGATSDIAALVHGKIHVNIGATDGKENPTYTGNAVLRNASIYGCNNLNGSPQNDVYIDIYQTAHNTTDLYNVTQGATFAIANVYGGGNRADYAPTATLRKDTTGINNDSIAQNHFRKPHIYVHGCENTIEELFAGGNAAAVMGDSLVFDGGRFGDVFGGGNGALIAANVGKGGVYLVGKGGRVGYIYEHCNKRGSIAGKVTFVNGSGVSTDCAEGVLKVENHFCGGNEVDVAGDFVHEFTCRQNLEYTALYGGCRLGTTYGNITLIITGGTFGTIYGGPKGDRDVAAWVRKYPTLAELQRDSTGYDEGTGKYASLKDEETLIYSKEVHKYMKEHPEKRGNGGGNVTIILKGGTIGDVYGGCDYNGNVEGRITIIVDSTNTTLNPSLDSCALEVNNIYGGGNRAVYTPDTANSSNPGYISSYAYPYISLENGHVNQNVYGGGKGNDGSVNYGSVTSNPKIVMNPDVANSKNFLIKGNLYGGGELGQVNGSTSIDIDAGTVKGTVYGGGKGHTSHESFGLVTKNTLVDISGGTVERSVYGGGSLGSVGTFTETWPSNGTTNGVFHKAGEPKTCATNTGLCKVLLSGTAQVGVSSKAHMPSTLLPGDDEYGYVFAASQGIADSVLYPKANLLGVACTTYLEISGSALVTASAYGGSENGEVLSSTYVKVMGGQIGVGGQLVEGVFTPDPVYTSEQWTAAINAVKNGTIGTSYVNPFHECDHWPYGNAGNFYSYDIFADEEGYDSHGGSTTASDGHTFFGNVFGGGSGYYPFATGKWRRSAGRVLGHTKVEVTGGHILTSIYGGNETTDVLGDSCVVIFSGGTLGVPRTVSQMKDHPVTCYLFGAGKGDERVMFNRWTNVQNTRVTVSGGHIFGSVFGGGEDGHVMRNTRVDILGDAYIGTTGTSYVDGNVFGGGRGFSGNALTAGNTGGDADVNIYGSARLLGSVYGGGRLASVGYGLYTTDNANYGVMRDDNVDDDGNAVANFPRGHITVDIYGSAIIGNDDAADYGLSHSRGGNVFGGSMGRLVKLDGTMVLPLWHRLGCAKATTVNISDNVQVKGNVYGGSELGRVTDSITVNISGNVIVGRDAAGSYGHGNVYGGGMGHTLTDVEADQISNADTKDSIPTFAGLTGGTIKVNISGGAINNNVYGAGELASVGTIATVTKHTDPNTSYFLSWPYEYTYNGNSGDARVNITGGTIGFINGSDTTGGNIYGSARGTVGDRYVTGRLATARVTHVDINLTNPGDKIIGDVYGSGENGHVYDSAVVTLRNGLVLGNVFGGGKGVDKYEDSLKNQTTDVRYATQVYDIIAGKVFGNTKVNILGGRVAKNVYGGGNLASVGIGNYKGYGEGTNVSQADSLLAENSGHCYVTVLGGTIGPDTLTYGTTYNGNYAVTTGHVYGAGKGIVFPAAAHVGFDYDRNYYMAYVNKTTVVIGDSTQRSCAPTVLYPHVTGIVFGGGENGHVRFDTYIQTNRGQIGVRPLAANVKSDQGHWNNRGNIFGAGRGEETNTDGSYCQSAGSVTRNTTIDVLGARIYRNVQGGGAMASVGPIKGRTRDSSTCVINVRLPLATDTLGGIPTTNNAFGGYIGGGSRGIPSPDGYDNSALATCWNSQINIYRGWLKNTIYGGGENGQMLGNTQINVYGGYIRSTIYGGGKGSYKANETEAGLPGTYLNDTLSGYVYGNTEVNLLGGEVPFTYGGGRRASSLGTTTVNIGRDNNGTYEGEASFIAGKNDVYGGNQLAGSPRGNIYVNVYKTAHTTTDAASYTEDNGNGAPTYAIDQVYGGSYNSHYAPLHDTCTAQVHVYGCDNTIREVYGGSAASYIGLNAAGKGANCGLTIDGGRFDKVFGGGDGTINLTSDTDPVANVYGTATTVIHGGKFGSVFGGSNTRGTVNSINISIDNNSGCGDTIKGDEFFGGSNMADIGPTNLNTTLGCGVKFRAAYGGSNQANIIGNVTFTIEGGEFGEVYAGSKGDLASLNVAPETGHIDSSANIEGNTHLIIRGGKIHSAYGGSNINGNITGTITVDVDSTYDDCDWKVDYVYGGSNLTQYLPDDSTVTDHSPSPQVNILCGTVNNDVYGGGKGDSDVDTAGLVQSNPKVVMSQTDKGHTWVKGSIYGGGELAITDGNTEVNISAGTVGVQGSAGTNGNVYGGGRGDASKIKAGLVKSNSTVNIAGGRVWHNVYGGGSLASVGTFTYGAVDRSTKSQQITSCAEGTGLATVYISGGIIGNDGHENGMVFGSSRGDIDTILARMDTMAWAYATKVTIGDTTAEQHNMNSPQIKGSVYGGGENGHVKQDAYVHIYSGQVGYQSDRADDNTKNIDKSDPTYEFRGNVYGAGCGTDKFFIKDSIAQLKIHGTINHLEKGGGYHSPTDGDHSKDSIFKVYDYNMYAGVVQGNTHVKISGGHIFHNVYGGGAMANVGSISSLVQYKDMFADGSAHQFGLSYPNNFTFVEPTGYVHIDITGGRIGTMGSYDGDVFGGARGEAGDRFKMARYGNVRTAVININMPTVAAAYALDTFDVHECITGSVYGGAENGHINDSTFVTLTNGLVGHALYGGGKGKGEYIMHNLKHQYTKSGEGGWMAGDDSTATIFSLTAGKVYGNTRVVMNGGHVVRNIFGGGNQGSVGKGNYHGGSGDYCSAGYGERLEAGDTAVWLPLFRSSGTSTVIVNGGTVGLADATIKDSLPYGNVFGGCRGTAAPNVRQTLSPRVLYYPIFFAGYSNRTRVIIGDGTHTPRIYGSVYGGGMDGHVRWGTHVTVKSGEIGLAYNADNQTAVGTDNLDRKQWFLRGSVYGAGSGMSQYEATLKHTTERAGEGGWAVGDDSVGYLYSSSAGSVTHFTRVDIEGGTIHNNVYGGGSLASVGPPMMGQRHNAPIDSSLSVINISGGTIGTFADVVGYKVIHHDAVEESGTFGDPGYVAPVAAYDETVHYSYGGKVFGGSRGQIDVDNVSFSTVVWTQVNLSGGQAYGSVYGGGEVGTIKEDACVNVSGGIVGPNVAVKTTGPGGDSLSYVYGGGKGIGDDPSSTYKTFTNVKNTYVTVSGGRVCGSVFGGAEDGHVLGNTNVTVSNTVASSAYAAAHAGVAEGDVLSIPIIGTGGYTHEYDGCVLGGGRNALNKNASAGRVQGNTHVTVTGGRIMRTILGGGALARVGVNVDGVFKGIGAGNDTISFKDNSGNYDSINHGTTFVQVSGDTLLVPSANFGNVFVDGRTYRDIFSGTTVPNPAGTDSVVYLTTIGAPNGPILVDNDYTIGDIFGGGKGDTKDTVDILAGKVMNTYVEVSGSPRIMADIYAGGEMSCVGWYDTTGANTGVYYPGTGYTHVEITDDPRTGTPYEFSCANIHYGRPWTLIDSIGRIYHTCSGNVYGGGQGYVEEDGTHRWNWVQMGRVYQTEVKIHGGHFMGNVFGGGSRGIVKKDCHVTITGGTFGNHIVDDTTINGKRYNNRYNYGSIFGGGYGNHKTFWHYNDSCFVKPKAGGVGYDTILMQPLEFAGRVYGNTYVKITGGHIMDCVYGGGDMASTGWVERDADGKFQFNDPTKRHGGVCNVEISGNTIVGPLDYFGHNAYVYAAGRGVGYDPTEEFKTYCNVNEAHLIVALTEGAAANLSDKGPDQWDTTTMGGRIWGSLFGGGADSHVLDSVSVVVHSGIVGTQGTTSYDGNIFGGGRNYLNTNHTNGRVQGNIRVFVDGGTLQGTLYGGGRLAMSGIDTVGHFLDADHGNVDILVRGDVVIGNHTADSLLKSNESCGDIFGSGKGDIKNYEDIWAGRVTNARITVKDTVISEVTYSPRIYGSIFGGGEMASLGYWDDTITDGEGHVVFHTDGTGGTDYGVIYENTGRAVINLSGNLTVGSALEYTVAPYANPGEWTIYESTATDTTLLHTCTGNVFGGGQGDVEPSAPRWVSMGRSGSSVVNISGGTYYGNVYGGSEQGIVAGDTRLNISGGTFGYTDQEGAIHGHLDKVYTGDIYAAGYGSDDPSDNAIPYVYEDENGVEQTIANPINDSTTDSENLHLGWTPDVLAGRTYGDVRVDITGGTIHGSVYGGGSFASVGYELSSAKGHTTVNIGLPGADPTDNSQATGDATIEGEVFGANNFSGTPYGSTNVHIYKTAHTTDNTAPTAADTKTLVAPPDELTGEDVEAIDTTGAFALKAVYGGGNAAAHTPVANDGTTLVHVHYCEENTIKEVYGGGNAANTQNNHVIIDGGYIYEVFGGGNGAGANNPGADVSGTAHTEILGGLITNVFGGSNSKGNIGNTILEIEPDGNCDIMVANTYGGSNEAEGGGGVINLLCGTKIGTFYGGSRKANLVGDITLNVYGGTYENIFGGSQGTVSEPANIEGNVTLNFYGGNVQRLFGGSDVNGNITGTVLVNVDIDPYYKCDDGLRLDTVYGGGHDAAYTPFDPFRASPTVNIMNNRYYTFDGTPGTLTDSAYVHIIDVFGGGLGATATVTSYPRVVIGGFGNGSKVFNEETTVPYTRDVHIYGNAYGGGSMAPTNGNTVVMVRDAVIGETEESFTSGNLFGGGYGTTSKVNGDTYVGVFGLSDIKSNVYGGGNAGIVTGNTEVVLGYQEQILPPELIAYLDETDPSLVKAGFHSPTPNVHFRYTTDGSIPTTSTGNLYTDDILSPSHNKANDFLINWNQPIQMIGYLWDGPADESTGKVDSSMIPSIVCFDRSTMPIITFKDGTAHVGDPDSANFNGSVGAKIYYTLNGDEPTSSSTLWGTVREDDGSAFAIGANDVVKAFAVQRGCFNSEVAYLTADPPTVDNGDNTTTFTITAKPGERIIYTLGVNDTPTPISLMNHGQRPGQGPGEHITTYDTEEEAYGHTASASEGSTVTHKKRVYTNSKGESVTYRWNEVTAASSGNTTVTITAPNGTDCTVKAIVEHAGYVPSNIGAAVYRH